MTPDTRKNWSISVILFIYTVLVILPSYLPKHQESISEAINLTAIAGITILFLTVTYMIMSIAGSYRQTIDSLKKKLVESEKKQKESNEQHSDVLEKRMLEISVINASLNREVAERMQAEAEAKELSRQMALILDSAGEGIFGLDTEGRVIFVNTAAALMLGWENDELIGQSHHELVHHSHQDGTPQDSRSCPITQAYKDGIVHSKSDDVFWTKEGTSFPVEYVSTPIMDNSTITGAVVVFRDTSI